MSEPLAQGARLNKEAIIAAWNREEVAIILDALSAVDEQDLDYLRCKLDAGGRGRFWEGVIDKLQPVFKLEIPSSSDAKQSGPPESSP